MAESNPPNDRVVTYDPLIALMAKFENVKATNTSVDPFEGLGVEDRLKKHIIDGIKKGLEANIEAALRLSQGRIFGPGGAAEMLGIPATTLASRIKKLGASASIAKNPRRS